MRLLRRVGSLYRPAALGLIVLFPSPAQAEQLTLAQTVDGLVIFLTLDPADAVARDPMQEHERKMHRGSKPGDRTYHVQVELFEDGLARYRKAPEAARKLAGLLPTHPDLDRAELAAWTTVANVLLNLDETITKE